MILLMDQTRILVPQTMRKRLMDREHLAHPGISKIQNSLRAKYFWLGIEADVKRIVEACKACQLKPHEVPGSGPPQAGHGVCEQADASHRH